MANDFDNGKQAGHEAAAQDLASGIIEPTDEERHTPDWYTGWLTGYRESLEEHYGAKESGSSSAGN